LTLDELNASIIIEEGGFSGFVDLLRTLYESDDPEEKEQMREWAYCMGWNSRRVSSRELL